MFRGPDLIQVYRSSVLLQNRFACKFYNYMFVIMSVIGKLLKFCSHLHLLQKSRRSLPQHFCVMAKMRRSCYLLLAVISLHIMMGNSTESHSGPEELKELIANGYSVDSSVGVVVLGGLFPIHETSDGSTKERCGDITTYGLEKAMAMVYAVELINANPEILPSIKLGFEIQDTCSTTSTALNASLQFLPEVCLATSSTSESLLNTGYFSGIVGPGLSSVAVPVATLMNLFNTPQISYFATADVLSDKNDFTYFFRTVPPDGGQVMAMYDMIKMFNWTYVSIIYTDNVYGAGGFNQLQNLLASGDNTTRICIAHSIPVRLGANDSVFDSVVATLLTGRRNATVVVVFANAQTSNGVIDAWSRRNDTHNATWIVSDAAATSLDTNVVRGMLSVSPTITEDMLFTQWFKRIGLSNTEGSPWVDEYFRSFVCTDNSSITSEGNCVNESLSIADYTDYRQSLFVPAVINAVYAFSHALHNMSVVKCNKTLCSEILDQSGQRINGELLLEYLQNVTFTGSSEETVAFNSNQDLRNGHYIIYNVQPVATSNGLSNFGYVKVGSWSSGKLNLNVSSIWWNTGSPPLSVCSLPCQTGYFQQHITGEADCCWTCEPCTEAQISDGKTCSSCRDGYSPNAQQSVCEELAIAFLDWVDPFALVLLIASFFGAVMIIIFMAAFAAFRKTRVIKATSRELSAVFLCGTLICYLLPLVYIGRPHVVSCAIRRYGVWVCLSLCFGAILLKLIRIYRIFINRKVTTKKPLFIGWQSQLVFIGIIVAFQILIGTVWLIVEKPGVSDVVENEQIVQRCRAQPYIGTSVSLAYNLFLLVGCICFAILTRKVPADFNETRFLYLTVFSMCVIWVAFLPIHYSTAELEPTIYIYSQIVASFMTATCLVIFLVMPKLYLVVVKKQREEGSTTQGTSTAMPSAALKHQCTSGAGMSTCFDSACNTYSCTAHIHTMYVNCM